MLRHCKHVATTFEVPSFNRKPSTSLTKDVKLPLHQSSRHKGETTSWGGRPKRSARMQKKKCRKRETSFSRHPRGGGVIATRRPASHEPAQGAVSSNSSSAPLGSPSGSGRSPLRPGEGGVEASDQTFGGQKMLVVRPLRPMEWAGASLFLSLSPPAGGLWAGKKTRLSLWP
jgi:hypothetical protein